MRGIYKYQMTVSGLSVEHIPIGAKLLHVAAQRDKPILWVLVDPDAPTHLVTFKTVLTGEHLRNDDLDDFDYIGTFQMLDQSYVGHLYVHREELHAG